MNRILTLIFAVALFAGNASADGGGGLHWAAKKNDTETLRLLLDIGEDPNQADENGYTPLHVAAFYEKSAAVKMLLAAGADVGAKDNYGWTPLHAGVHSGRVSIVKMLLAAGADVKVKDNDGETPLQYLTSSRTKYAKKIAPLLIEAAKKAKPASPAVVKSKCDKELDRLYNMVSMALSNLTASDYASKQGMTDLLSQVLYNLHGAGSHCK